MTFTSGERARIKSLLSVASDPVDIDYYLKVIIPKIIKNKAVYKTVADSLGCPIAFVACLHVRESSSDVGVFEDYLGNGQPLSRVTTIVPKGRGPFKSWSAGAIDALKVLKGIDKIKSWDLERMIYEWERFNGFGYRKKGINSPYVWSKILTIYKKGKFVKDRTFDKDKVDEQIGCYALYLELVKQDRDFSIVTTTNNMENKVMVIPKYKEKSENVVMLQDALNAHGAGITVDGIFGPKTKEAVSRFQKANGLAGSGIIGEKTMKYLGLSLDKVDSVKLEIPKPAEKEFNKMFLIGASGQLGVKEAPGKANNKQVMEYHKFSTKANKYGFEDSVPWCSSFVCWVVENFGAIESTNSAAARSWEKWAFGKKIEPGSGRAGDIVVFWRNSLKSGSGHVGFFLKETKDYVWVLGGNQSDEVNVTRYSKARLRGYFRHKDDKSSATELKLLAEKVIDGKKISTSTKVV